MAAVVIVRTDSAERPACQMSCGAMISRMKPRLLKLVIYNLLRADIKIHPFYHQTRLSNSIYPFMNGIKKNCLGKSDKPIFRIFSFALFFL